MEPGDALGRYVLLRRIASGGMGEVFLAARPGPVGFGPWVALKVLRSQLVEDKQFVDMLVDEANISMFLNHQNVVSVLDLAEHENRYFIAMEYVQGMTADRLVDELNQRGRTLDVSLALFIAVELMRALKYAHTRVDHSGQPLGIIHRDVTPANLLLSMQGEVKLTDFGIARARKRIHQTQAGMLKGKFGYMAPEMIRGDSYDHRVDLFCAGVSLYLLLTGHHPAAHCTVLDAIQRFENRQVAPPSSHNPLISSELDAVVAKALEPDPDRRWSSASELGEALQDCLLGRTEWRSGSGASALSELLLEVAPELARDPVEPELLKEMFGRHGARPGAPTHGSLPPVAGGVMDGPALPTSSPSNPVWTAVPSGQDPAAESAAETDDRPVLTLREPELHDTGPPTDRSPLARQATLLDDRTVAQPPSFHSEDDFSAEEDETLNQATVAGPPPQMPAGAEAVSSGGVEVQDPKDPAGAGFQSDPAESATVRSPQLRAEVRAALVHAQSEPSSETSLRPSELPVEQWTDDMAARHLLATRNAAPAPDPALQASSPVEPDPVPAAPSHRPGIQGPRRGTAVWLRRVAALLVAAAAAVIFLVSTEVLWPQLYLTTEPAGASVWVNGERRGTTPVRVRVPPGRVHSLEFFKPGYARERRKTVGRVVRGRSYTVQVQLRAASP